MQIKQLQNISSQTPDAPPITENITLSNDQIEIQTDDFENLTTILSTIIDQVMQNGLSTEFGSDVGTFTTNPLFKQPDQQNARQIGFSYSLKVPLGNLQAMPNGSPGDIATELDLNTLKERVFNQEEAINLSENNTPRIEITLTRHELSNRANWQHKQQSITLIFDHNGGITFRQKVNNQPEPDFTLPTREKVPPQTLKKAGKMLKNVLAITTAYANDPNSFTQEIS